MDARAPRAAVRCGAAPHVTALRLARWARVGQARVMLLCLARLPGKPDDVARIARALGLAAADVAHRVAGVLPRAILSCADEGAVLAQARALLEVGALAFAVEPSAAPLDEDRAIARAVAPSEAGLGFDDRGGRHVVPWEAVSLVLGGVRASESTETITTKERKFSLGRAVLTSGLSMSKTTEKTETKTHVARESFLLVARGDGEPDVMLYERRLDYAGLGRVEPSSLANFRTLGERIRARAPHARFDDRAARPGFVSGPLLGVPHGVDVALHLVRLALEHGA